jgi:hypothetical protein
MFNKILKTPTYLGGGYKRAKTIGVSRMVNELFTYNRYYYRLLQSKNIPVRNKTILFHTAFYCQIARMLPHIEHDELMKYIPSTVTHGIYQILNINRREITYDKYHMYFRMKRAGINIPEVYYVTNKSLNNIWKSGIDVGELRRLSKNTKIIGKPRYANAGKGIYIYNGEKIKPDYVYQRFILNHPTIISLQGNNYCSTVRYIVYNKSGSVIPLGAFIRINAGNVDDHASAGSSAAILSHSTGEIISEGFLSNGKSYETHPVSGITVKGFKIPNWHMCLSEIKKTCNEYKELPLIAFDIAISGDNCSILEINAGCGTLISQYQERWHDHQFVKDFYKN